MPTTNWQELFDLAQAEGSTEYTALPAGTYLVVVSKATPDRTKDNTKDCFKLQFKVAEGPHKGRVLFDQLTVSPGNGKAMGIFFDRFAALGLTMKEWFAQGPDNAQTAAAVVGRPLNVEVTVGEWGGKANNDVKKYVVPNEGERAAALRYYAELGQGGSASPTPSAVPTPSTVSNPAVPTPAAPVPTPAAPAVPVAAPVAPTVPTTPAAPAVPTNVEAPPPPPLPY